MEGCNICIDNLQIISGNSEAEKVPTYGTIGCIFQHMECQYFERWTVKDQMTISRAHETTEMSY